MKVKFLALAYCSILCPLFAQPVTTIDRTAPPSAQWGWAIYQGDIEWVHKAKSLEMKRTELISKFDQVAREHDKLLTGK